MAKNNHLLDTTPQDKNIEKLDISKEISNSYISYAMSVIVSRALPDVRDGMKPVHRRILHAMNELWFTHSGKHRKSATVVGEVIGKYHPHGDNSVYDAMVKLAQPWAMRYPLVDGQGNFGSIDGDGAAAMRYTEARLTKLADEMLQDIKLDTVAWRPNFDNTLEEPITLPTRFPNHLCNGTMGIAVGMATNTGPHNLREVIDASLYYLKHGEETTIDDVMAIIKGPDFPTWGMIYDPENILEVYRKGKWSIIVRGKTHIEPSKWKWGDSIVITEIPYQVNKASLVEKIGDLVMEKKLEGITDVRDESARNEIRIVIQLTSKVNTERMLAKILKMTPLQSSFALNNVSLVHKWKQPRLLNILDMVAEYVIYRREVVYRRSVFQLGKAKDRLHLLEGLRRAIDIIDDVIETIKSSDTRQAAKDALMSTFDFSDAQAEYILQMRLQSLVGLEMQKILDEIDEKTKLITYLENIINNPEALDNVVEEEMIDIKERYGDDRRTQVIDETWNVKDILKAFADKADKIKEDVIVWISDDYELRVLYQSRVNAIPENTIDLIYTHNQDKVVVITDRGELIVERLKDLWKFYHNSAPLDFKKEYKLKGNVVFAKTLHANFDSFMLLSSENSIKKVDKELILSFKKFPTTIMNLPQRWEKILKVLSVEEEDDIVIATKRGRLLIFNQDQVRPMGKTAWGIKAIDLQEGDSVATMFVYQSEPFILLNTTTKAIMYSLEDLRIWRRARAGDEVALLDAGENIVGGTSIYEGAIRLKLNDGTIQTVHSDDCELNEPGSRPVEITKKPIMMMYRPREEKEENMAYREQQKTEKKLKRQEEKIDADEDDHEEE